MTHSCWIEKLLARLNIICSTFHFDYKNKSIFIIFNIFLIYLFEQSN
jgi:hypothetical protein